MKVAILVIVLIVLAYCFWPRSNFSEVEEVSQIGILSDLLKYFDLFQNETPFYGTLIISVKDTDKFVQFSRDGESIEINFPLITEEQKSLELRFREACERQRLDVREVSGSDGSLFLDADLPQGTQEKTEVVKNVLMDIFDITESEKLQFRFF